VSDSRLSHMVQRDGEYSFICSTFASLDRLSQSVIHRRVLARGPRTTTGCVILSARLIWLASRVHSS